MIQTKHKKQIRAIKKTIARWHWELAKLEPVKPIEIEQWVQVWLDNLCRTMGEDGGRIA